MNAWAAHGSRLPPQLGQRRSWLNVALLRYKVAHEPNASYAKFLTFNLSSTENASGFNGHPENKRNALPSTKAGIALRMRY